MADENEPFTTDGPVAGDAFAAEPATPAAEAAPAPAAEPVPFAPDGPDQTEPPKAYVPRAPAPMIDVATGMPPKVEPKSEDPGELPAADKDGNIAVHCALPSGLQIAHDDHGPHVLKFGHNVLSLAFWRDWLSQNKHYEPVKQGMLTAGPTDAMKEEPTAPYNGPQLSPELPADGKPAEGGVQ